MLEKPSPRGRKSGLIGDGYDSCSSPIKESKKDLWNFDKLSGKKYRKSRFTMIVKPDCMSQGKGIFLTHNLDEIPKDDVYVVQQYLREPYLIDNLKFDMRLYVLVLCAEPLKIFLYQDGIVRFATQNYQPLALDSDKKQLDNLCVHLTNYAVNKGNDDFIMPKNVNDETSHKRSLHKVLARLK